MSIDYAKALAVLAPEGGYVLVGNEYEGLTWLANSPKPTDKQLKDAWADIVAAADAKAAALASARVKLGALGLTEAEIKALVG